MLRLRSRSPAAASNCASAPELPFRSMALVGLRAASPLAPTSCASSSPPAACRCRRRRHRPQVVLEALADAREKGVVASTAAGQVREVQLRVQAALSRRHAERQASCSRRPRLLLTRDMSYSETTALAKEQEEALLYRAMEDDIVAQVLRRLAAIKPA